MPSIPQSLLWISLVVLWLFVLVPMLINKRDTVRRTSDVALATRVLNTGRAARLLKRRAPAAGHRSDPKWQPEAEVDDPEDFDEDKTGPVVVTGRPSRVRSVAVVTALAEEDEPDYLDVDVVDEDSGALPVGKMAGYEPQTDELPLEFDSADTEEVPEPVAETEAEPEAEVAEQPAEDAPEADGTADEYEYIDDTSGLEPEAEAEDEPVRARTTSRYATKTAAAVSARKYRFRTRVLLGMAVALVASAAAAFLVSPSAWYVCATIAAMTLIYLGYLRRQTRIEERLRRRRLQRMARAKLGVENTRDQELDVVPSRLRRPGAAVLEIDDEDPIFEHLEYASFAREFDLPRAAGQ
ncbi:MAG: hypothetical protein HYZ38_18620 [Mycobacterium sp.]|nr:hypothetical protein [Mycobacterium sp.]